MSIGEFCNREVVIATAKTGADEAARLMRQYHVGDLVVTEEREGKNCPVGIVTDRDLVLEVLAQGAAADAVRVGDIMAPTLHSVSEQDELWSVLEAMRAAGVRRMPVVDHNGALVGLITLDDLLELLSEATGQMVALIRSELHQEANRRA